MIDEINHHVEVSVDTLDNEELTHNAVEHALDLIVQYGHARSNVVKAAKHWSFINNDDF